MTLSTAAFSDPMLLGEWRSDRALTMRFIRQNVKIEEKTDKFLDEMMGRLTMKVTKDQVQSILPSWDIQIGNKMHHMVGFNETHPYTIISSNDNVVVVSSVEPVTGKASITIYNFDAPDTMWIYTGGADKALPNSHYREYFVRLRQGQSNAQIRSR